MKSVAIACNIPPETQEFSFMNATLQSTGDRKFGFSVATFVNVESVRTQTDLKRLLARVLGSAVKVAAAQGVDLQFEVQIGRETDNTVVRFVAHDGAASVIPEDRISTNVEAAAHYARDFAFPEDRL